MDELVFSYVKAKLFKKIVPRKPQVSLHRSPTIIPREADDDQPPRDTVPCTFSAWFCKCILWSSVSSHKRQWSFSFG
jgi:hypothetical protein